MGAAELLDTGVDDALQQALDYWQRLRGERNMPARKDLNPADIPRLLPKLMLADVSDPEADSKDPHIRFRLVGTEVVGRYGSELTGHRLSEIDYGSRADDVAALYRRAIDCAKPQFARIEFWQDHDRLIRTEHLLLPLSDDGTNVNMILVAVHWQ
ncbi:MAG: PAS domain-containing protein [Alphaproteobacteria bacterium]|jgi:hypothetical protein|nr:PAS domain-containing protein [Alphaproteobacteria bacterium]MDP6874085.1 PAS domain-containing protein [Alphaproteobacteria bacterium]